MYIRRYPTWRLIIIITSASTKRDFNNFLKMSSPISTALFFLALIYVSCAQHIDHPDGRSERFHTQDYSGNYHFGYDTVRSDGSRDGRTERGDIHGNVVGSYNLLDTDGRSRTVDYTAGEDGFQAVVRTNEPGTANQSPAYVSINSDAPRGTHVAARPPTDTAHPPPVTTVRRPYRPVYRPRPTQYQHYDPYNHRGDYGHHSHSHYRYDYPPYY